MNYLYTLNVGFRIILKCSISFDDGYNSSVFLFFTTSIPLVV